MRSEEKIQKRGENTEAAILESCGKVVHGARFRIDNHDADRQACRL